MSDNYLYAISGGTPQNERISMHNLHNQTWQSIEPLTQLVGHHGIAPYQSVIWVFGGRTSVGPDEYTNNIWNIYTEDGSVALLPEALPSVFSLNMGTMTFVDNVVYLFGDQSVKYVIPPSDNPAKTPTDNPSNNPSLNPSKMPINTPTDDPSLNPSKMPTNTPTDAPSPVLTFVPLETTSLSIETTAHGALKPPKSSGMNSVTVIIIIVCVFSVVACLIVMSIWCLARRIWFQKNKKRVVQGCTTSKEDDKDDCGPVVPDKFEMPTANMLKMQDDTRTVAIMENDDNDMIQSNTHEIPKDNNKNAMQMVQSEGVDDEVDISLEGSADYMGTSGNIAPDEFVIEEDH
eukprot:243701_1